MKIVALCRTLNEQDRIEKFCLAYQFADLILIGDGGSTDNTVELALKYPKVKVREFSKTVKCGGGIQRNPDGEHLNFLYDWGREEDADWIISQDCDQRPNLYLKQQAREIMENTNKEFILGVQIYLWLKTQWFPQMSKSEGNIWAHGIWAHNAKKVHLTAIDKMPHYEFSIDEGQTSILPDRTNMAHLIDPPLCYLHFGWETTEMVDKMIDYYRKSGLIKSQEHPLQFGGVPSPIENWMIE